MASSGGISYNTPTMPTAFASDAIQGNKPKNSQPNLIKPKNNKNKGLGLEFNHETKKSPTL